jgi:hypothetical protein
VIWQPLLPCTSHLCITNTDNFYLIMLIKKYSYVILQHLEEARYISASSKDSAWAALKFFYRMDANGQTATGELAMVYGTFCD